MSEVPTSARVLGAIGRGLITAGIVILLFVLFQLWGTNVQESRAQDDLRDEFGNIEVSVADALAQLDALQNPDGGQVIDAGDRDLGQLPAPTTTTTLPGGLTTELLRYFFPEDGDAVARIEIPAIDVDKIVVNGVQVADLRKGPGHYATTATAGTVGNTAIAGHRTTYGAPFNRIDELAPGDEIRVTSVLGTFTYRVMEPSVAFPDELATVDDADDGHIIVRPADTWVLGDFGDNRVTLTACHPKLSSRQRIIVAAALVEDPVESPALDPDVVAALGGDPTDATLPGETTGAPDSDAEPANLDEGLNGERDAIPGAVVWMLAATTIWVLAGHLGRHLFSDRLRRVAVRAVSLVPVALCLWFSFELLDRALPAG
ncbi:MAG: sortase [Acidimicrobiales bacterium]